jgi:tRNA threonylcarbamoyladenosine biosynthesis protein TsaE
MIRISHSVAETEAIAAQWAGALVAGQCVALDGELGAGKTQFVRGLAMGLGANPRMVSSPTFVLLNIYPGGRLKLFHLDAYRARGAEDLESIGFTELLEQGGIVVVEWASRVKALLPADHLKVEIEMAGAMTRRISLPDAG